MYFYMYITTKTIIKIFLIIICSRSSHRTAVRWFLSVSPTAFWSQSIIYIWSCFSCFSFAHADRMIPRGSGSGYFGLHPKGLKTHIVFPIKLRFYSQHDWILEKFPHLNPRKCLTFVTEIVSWNLYR